MIFFRLKKHITRCSVCAFLLVLGVDASTFFKYISLDYFSQNFILSPSCILFNGILYKIGGIFCFSWHLLEVISSSVPNVKIKYPLPIGKLLAIYIVLTIGILLGILIRFVNSLCVRVLVRVCICFCVRVCVHNANLSEKPFCTDSAKRFYQAHKKAAKNKIENVSK